MLEILKKKNSINLICILLFLMLCIGLVLGLTVSSLSSSKTATGVVSFTVPPSVNGASQNICLFDGQVFAGLSNESDTITQSTAYAPILFVKKHSTNVNSNAYIKLVLTFYGTTGVTHNGNSAYFLKNNDTNDAQVNYVGKDTTTISDSTILTFKTASSVSQYGRLHLDSIFCGLSSTNAFSVKVMEINAIIYEDSNFSNQLSSMSLFMKARAMIEYDINITNSSDKLSVSGESIVVGGDSYTFSVTSQSGYAPSVSGLPSNYTSSTNGNTTTYVVNSVSSDLNLTITSTPINYTITYNTNGGSTLASKSYTIETTAFTLPTPTKANYILSSWTASSTDNSANNWEISLANGASISGKYGNVTLTAIWTLGMFTITADVSSSYGDIDKFEILNVDTNETVESGEMVAVGTNLRISLTYSDCLETSTFYIKTADDTQVFYSSLSASSTYNIVMPAKDVIIYAWLGFTPCCVSADTLITMADGTTKRADEIEYGDAILSYNFETKQLESSVITDILKVNRKELITINFKDGTNIKVTTDHPLFTELGWKCYDYEFGYGVYGDKINMVGAFAVGDKMFSLSTYFDKEVESIIFDNSQNSYETYTFTTDKNNNYFGNGVLNSGV